MGGGLHGGDGMCRYLGNRRLEGKNNGRDVDCRSIRRKFTYKKAGIFKLHLPIPIKYRISQRLRTRRLVHGTTVKLSEVKYLHPNNYPSP